MIQKMSRTWKCPNCDTITEWEYTALAEQGEPVCPDCDTDMQLLDADTVHLAKYTCPHCKKEQTKIVKWINASIAQQYDVDSGQYEKDVDEEYGEHESYECPTCGKELDYEFVETQVQHPI